MSKRLVWVAAFLGVTLAAIVMEVVAAVVGSEDMPTWTDLIVEHVHWEVFAVVWGALVVWTGVHFGIRYWNKNKESNLMQTPSLGRIVLVPCDTTVNNGADVAPAVITRVWGEHPDGWTVNLRVLLDATETPWRTSQILCETEERARELGAATAWWPPRV